MKKKTILILLILILSFILVSAMFGCKAASEGETFRLIVPEDWELEVGDSRSIDYAFDSGVTDRRLTFEVSNKNRASIDSWGRVTALKKGNVRITAKTEGGDKATVKLRVVKESKNKGTSVRTVSFQGTAVELNSVLQKIVTRYPTGDDGVPAEVSGITDYSSYQTATTKDGAVWTITDYGVLRVDENAPNSRDREQRFMGDRYFYKYDGVLLGIVGDGENGIWTIMAEGVTHIDMVDMSGIEKAYNLHEQTKQYVDRRGMVSNAYLQEGDVWGHGESENEGLWTSMYGVGELMRYSVLKNTPNTPKDEIDAARESAMRATEAVLLLSNLRVGVGTTEAYVRYQPNAIYDEERGKYLSETALEENGDPSLNIPNISPAETFKIAYEKYLTTGELVYVMEQSHLFPFTMDDWSDPRTNEGVDYAVRTRLLDGYWARSYSLEDENNPKSGYIHWEFNQDGTALGVSTKAEDSSGYYINGENMRGIKLNAISEVPARLWDNLIGEGYSLDDLFYKGDTSADAMIGHLFLFKVAFDVLGQEDGELKNIIASTMDRMAQHISDNNYMVVDGGGQPNTWSKFNREFFYNGSQLGGAPLTSAVVLSLFKLAHYTTGYEKWHNEYRMAALDPAYEYAKLMTQYDEQAHMLLLLTLDNELTPEMRRMLNLELDFGSPRVDFLTRMFLNYSDEEMAMLAYYLLFQMEDDEVLLEYYREGLEDWWKSIKYSENPLWYYIYQLAHPSKTIIDAYGNNILDTASWSLSRHPIELIKYSASNDKRDDIAELSLHNLIPEARKNVLTYDISGDNKKLEIPNDLVLGISRALIDAPNLKWVVAAPDEKAFAKFNKANYVLHSYDHEPYVREGSTTYTLPFWLGLYHGMLKI
ncbi:MAG: Ig-like domain-containing protein [Clostridia bacterium]